MYQGKKIKKYLHGSGKDNQEVSRMENQVVSTCIKGNNQEVYICIKGNNQEVSTCIKER